MKASKYIISVLAAAVACVEMSAAVPEKKDTVITYPWGQKLTYWQTTGSGLSVNIPKLETKVAGDLRNRMTGVVPGMDVRELTGGFDPSAYAMYTMNNSHIQLTMRGNSDLMCIVNDMYIPFSSLLLDPNQIESITVLTDVVDRAKYGPLATNGALLIRTKQGGYNTPMRIHVDMESGISMAGRVPEWVNGVEYAQLNNAARAASGYDELYSPEAIEGFAKNDPYDLLYPNVDYKSLMYKNSYPLSRAGVSFYGGGNSVRYNFALNGLYSGDLVKGGATTDYSRFNISAGMAAKIGRYIEVSVDFSSLLSFQRSGRTSWNSYRTVPSVAYPLVLGTATGDEETGEAKGTTVYGVSRTFPNNYYALQMEGGFRTHRMRTGLFNTALDIDLSWLLDGLHSRTGFSNSSFVQTTIGKNNDYLAYYWTQESGKGEISGHRGTRATGKSTFDNYSVQALGMYERLSYDKRFGMHNIAAGATFTLNSTSNKASTWYQRQMYGIADLSYSYADKYIAEFVAEYAGTHTLNRANRFGFFPTAGLAWVASNEGFLKSVSWVDNLKLRAQAGIIGQTSLFDTPYLYRGIYSFGNSMNYGPNDKQDCWFGGTANWVSQKTTISRVPNEDLSWAKIYQVDAGLDFDFLNMFSFNTNFFYRKIDGIIANTTSVTPGVFGLSGMSMFENFTAISIRGVDATLNYDQSFGDFRVSAGVSAQTWIQKNDKVVEDNYLYDYQKKTGANADAIWGYRCIGKFTDESQLAAVPAYSSDVAVGDLMYEDVNNDGKIDANDQVIIGHSNPRLYYQVNLGFAWKNLEMSVIGAGRAFFKTAMTNDWFWNGTGDGNYSAFVRDNIGGDYPRLAYVKDENNFVTSDFWLRNGGWFKIKDVEIAYTLPLRNKAIRSVRFSVRGQNLATITGVKDVDPENINAGVSSFPLMKTITGGIKLNF